MSKNGHLKLTGLAPRFRGGDGIQYKEDGYELLKEQIGHLLEL